MKLVRTAGKPCTPPAADPRRRHAAGRRGWRIKPGRGQLEQPHRPVQVLQLMLAHIHQREPQALPLLLILDQRPASPARPAPARPAAAAQIRAARCTASPVYPPPAGTACPV